MMFIVKLGNRSPQRLDPSRRSILSTGHRDIYRMRPLEAAFDIIIHLGSPLAKIGPRIWLIQEAMFVCAFRRPHDTRRGS